MTTRTGFRSPTVVLAALTGAASMLLPAPLPAQDALPRYEVDLGWPRLPFPNRWVIGQVGGVCVDSNDHVFLLNRQDLVDEELDAGTMAPPVIELDPAGNIVDSWGDPAALGALLHDCAVDRDNNIWVIGARAGFIQKYSRDGELLLQIGESGRVDSSDGTPEGRPLNSDAAQFFQPAGIAVDPANGDVYLADGEAPGTNARVAVMDREGRFLRQWRLHRAEGEEGIVPVLHCLRMSDDGLVYVCDRRAQRIQVFDKMGNFQRNIDVPWKQYTPHDGKRRTGAWGSAAALAFSRDPEQRYLFVVNEDNEQIEIMERLTGKHLATFGHGAGHFPGQFTHAHGIALDSRGNVYVAEVNVGKRAQRFRVVR